MYIRSLSELTLGGMVLQPYKAGLYHGDVQAMKHRGPAYNPYPYPYPYGIRDD